MSSEESVLENALKYARLGFKVLPVTSVRIDKTCSCRKSNCNAPGKHPAARGWQDTATSDEAIIRKWIDADPNLNIGIKTGGGRLVLDVDPRHGGFESLKELEDNIGSLPTTAEAITGGGGRHLFFSVDREIRNTTAFMPGLDTRGDGGFVVAPPSKHASGNLYQWAPGRSLGDIPLAPAPAKLLALLEKPKATKTSEMKSVLSASAFAEGNRNNGLFKLGCSLQSKALDSGLIRTMLHLTNEAQCNPPLEDSEVDSIWKSCVEYAVESGNADPIQYLEQNGRIIYNSQKGDEIKQITLSNFTARISEEKIIDDGLDQRTSFILTGKHQDGRQFPQVEISAEYFSGLSWVTKNWGSSAIVSPGFSTRDHLRAAIQELSLDKKQSTVFIHLGWRKLEGEYIFLHAGGAIGANGCRNDIAVDASEGKLKDFILPEPVTGSELKNAFKASLRILDAGPPHTIYPMYCSIGRAPLNEISTLDFSLFIMGQTGVFKTSLFAIVQAHFGLPFTDRRLPEYWISTANSIEKKVFLAKDVVFIVDDYVPGVVPLREVERIVRGVGNQSGRGRMRSDGHSLRHANHPRCFLVSTGEDVPEGQSLRPRMFIVEVNSGDISPVILTELQDVLRSGQYAKVLSSYLKWLAPKLDLMRESFNQRQNELRILAATSDLHKRTPGAVSSLFAGLEVFLTFAVESNSISADERDHYLKVAWAGLGEAAEKQRIYQISEDPAKRFIDLIGASFIAGRAHLLAKPHGKPADAKRWGWREGKDGYLYASGEQIGWVTEREVWLNPELAYSAAQRFAYSQKTSITIGKEALWKRLAHEGIILPSIKENKNLPKREVSENYRPRVLVIPDKNIFSTGFEVTENPRAPGAPSFKREGVGPFSDEDLEEIKKHSAQYRPPATNKDFEGNNGGAH